MAKYPYTLTLQIALAASSTGTLSYNVPQNESLELNDMRFISTSTFNVTDIRDSSGKHYTNASAAQPILSSMLQSAANANLSVKDFQEPLLIDGGKTFYIDLIDTSAAPNTVRLVFTGKRESQV